MSPFKPHRYFSRISAIDPRADLRDKGIRAVLLDMDNTLLTRDTHEVPQDVRSWLKEAERAGVMPCIFTNNWHASAHECAADLGLPIIARAMKPFPFAYWAAFRKLGVKPCETACVGDQLFTDIWGGRFAGLHAIMVEPLVAHDLKHTLLLRNVERLVLRDVHPER